MLSTAWIHRPLDGKTVEDIELEDEALSEALAGAQAIEVGVWHGTIKFLRSKSPWRIQCRNVRGGGHGAPISRTLQLCECGLWAAPVDSADKMC